MKPILLALISVLAGSCGGSVSAVPSAGDVPHYEMSLTLSPSEHKMRVEGEVTLPPERTAERQVNFRISNTAGPIAWRSLTPSVRIEADREVVGAKPGEANPSAAGAKAIWRLKGDWPTKTTVRIGFSYELITPQPDGFVYVGPEISFGAGGWYPAIGGAKATSVLHIAAPEGSAVSAVGRPGSGLGPARWSFTSLVPAELLFTVSPPGSPSLDISPALRLTSLKRRATDEGWRTGLRGVQTALEAEFGPLPYPHITVVEVPDAIADKAGFGAFAAPGAVLASSRFIDQPFNVAAFAHEFSHLWWGNHVALQGKKGDFLLDEGLAQYGSMVAVDRVLGAAAGERYRRRGIPGFRESLYSALGCLEISAAGFDRPLLALQDDDLSYWVAYSKAGLAWYALAEEMGRPNYRAALQDIVAAHGAGAVTWDAFVAALQHRGSVRLGPFIDAWFGASGAPAYTLDWHQAGGVVAGRVTASESIKPATLELELTFPTGRRERHRLAVPPQGAEFRFNVKSPAAALVLDPDYKILRWTRDLRTEAQAMSEYMRALILARLGKKAEAEKILLGWVGHAPRHDRYDRLLLTHAALARLAEDRGCTACAVSHIKAALTFPAQRPERLVETYITIALAARRLKQPGLAARAAAVAISADQLVGKANGAAAKLATGSVLQSG